MRTVSAPRGGSWEHLAKGFYILSVHERQAEDGKVAPFARYVCAKGRSSLCPPPPCSPVSGPSGSSTPQGKVRGTEREPELPLASSL